MNSLANQPFVEITERGEVRVRAKSVAEARLALKELKLHKKAYGVRKKEVTNQQQHIRAAYTDKVRRQGSKVRGGGGLGKFLRGIQTASREADRENLAKQLSPLDKQKAQYDAIITAIDKTIIQVEAYILQNSS